MRVAAALLASAVLVAGAAPALAGDAEHPSDRLTACNSLGDRPTQAQIHACVAAAERFAADHRAIAARVRVEIEAHRADIQAAMRDNADAIRQAEQEVRASMDELRSAMRELRESEGYLGEVPLPPSPPDVMAPPAPPPQPPK